MSIRNREALYTLVFLTSNLPKSFSEEYAGYQIQLRVNSTAWMQCVNGSENIP